MDLQRLLLEMAPAFEAFKPKWKTGAKLFEIFANGWYKIIAPGYCQSLYDQNGIVVVQYAEYVEVFDNGWYCVGKDLGGILYDENRKEVSSYIGKAVVYANGWYAIGRGICYQCGSFGDRIPFFDLYRSDRTLVEKRVIEVEIYKNGWCKVCYAVPYPCLWNGFSYSLLWPDGKKFANRVEDCEMKKVPNIGWVMRIGEMAHILPDEENQMAQIVAKLLAHSEKLDPDQRSYFTEYAKLFGISI